MATRTDLPIDLRDSGTDPWAAVRVPHGWEPIGGMCRRVWNRLDPLTQDVVGCIRAEIPAYTHEAAVPQPDLAASVFRNLEMMLIGVAEHRGATEEELQVRRRLGSRRAIQGLPVEALLQAYHVGYRELWHALVEEAGEEGAETSMLLLTAATTVWNWIHQVTNVVADAYRDSTRKREARMAGIRQRFIELLVAGDVESPQLGEIAHSLGLDIEGSFIAACARLSDQEATDREDVQADLAALRGVHVSMVRGHNLFILSQGSSEESLAELIDGLAGAGALGVGLARRGLEGARLSIGDAEAALTVSLRRGRPSVFHRDWFWALTLQSDERLRVMLAAGAGVARTHPDLARTVETFARAGFSAAETARRLSIHLNTVIYRLDRWEKLTGWNPRTFDGLLASQASLV